MISHHHRTIFVHIPKCGGQSVEQAFLDDLGLTWAERAPLLLGRNPSPRLGPPRLAHLSARQYRDGQFVTEAQWRDYFTFAVVRDPVARAVSLFNHLAPVATLDAFLHDWLPAQFALAPHYDTPEHGNPGMYHFIRPQRDFVTGTNGAILPDRIVRLEDLAASWPDLQAATGLTAALPHRNASTTGATPRDLTQRDLDRIAALYAQDFEAFGYDPQQYQPASAGRRTPALRRLVNRIAKGT
jgi:hypothetical protein